MGYKYLVKQHDITDCAAACLATVCMYYKKEITITKLRDILGTDIKGTTLLGLEDGAKKLGFDTKAIRIDKNGFKEKYTLPAIAHVITKEGLSHFVIVHKIKKDEVIVLDPAKGKEKKNIDEFFKSFAIFFPEKLPLSSPALPDLPLIYEAISKLIISSTFLRTNLRASSFE